MKTEPENSPSVIKSGILASFRYAGFMILERLLRCCVHPKFRAHTLRLFGAKVGKNVRVYEARFINLQEGFSNLIIGNDVHIGFDCLFDLAAPIQIGARSTLSPRVTVISHSDPGSAHGSVLASIYAAEKKAVAIGTDCWIGAGTTILSGITIDDTCMVAAGSVVTKDVPRNTLVAGVPAIVKGTITTAHPDSVF